MKLLSDIWKRLKHWWLGRPARKAVAALVPPLPPSTAATPAVLPEAALEPVPPPPLPEPPAVEPSPPRPEAWLTGRFACEFGALDYRLYRPPGADGAGPRTLVMMLHGCRQDAEDFARGTGFNALAREAGVWVLYPEQSQRANRFGCWNWFARAHQQRESGEPALLAALTRRIAAEEGIAPERIAVAGLSAGGAMAALLGHTHPDLFCAVGVHSGLAPGAAGDMIAALGAMKLGAPPARPPARGVRPMVVFHGDADTVVHPDNAEFLLASVFGGPPPLAGVSSGAAPDGTGWTRRVWPAGPEGPAVECWIVHGAGHAWSGGAAAGSFADPAGPSASREMLRFFLAHPGPAQAALAGERDKFHTD